MSDFYRKVETNINFLFIICSTLPRKILLFVANKEENWRVILPENYWNLWTVWSLNLRSVLQKFTWKVCLLSKHWEILAWLSIWVLASAYCPGGRRLSVASPSPTELWRSSTASLSVWPLRCLLCIHCFLCMVVIAIRQPAIFSTLHVLYSLIIVYSMIIQAHIVMEHVREFLEMKGSEKG